MGVIPNPAPLPEGEQAGAISKLLVRVIADYTGRGPMEVRTFMAPGVITVVLRDTLTKGERRLVEEGRTEFVIDMRRTFQHLMADTLKDGIKEITGVEVDAFLSDHHVNPDIAVETFVMKSVAGDEGR